MIGRLLLVGLVVRVLEHERIEVRPGCVSIVPQNGGSEDAQVTDVVEDGRVVLLLYEVRTLQRGHVLGHGRVQPLRDGKRVEMRESLSERLQGLRSEEHTSELQ